MKEPSRIAVEIATRSWLAALNREFLARNPNRPDMPFPSWEEWSPEVRACMMRCIRVALIAGSDENVRKVMLRQA